MIDVGTKNGKLEMRYENDTETIEMFVSAPDANTVVDLDMTTARQLARVLMRLADYAEHMARKNAALREVKEKLARKNPPDV